MPRRKRKKSVNQGPSAPLIREGVREQYFFLPATIILASYVYYTTLCPTVFVGDSGELTTAAYFLGIPHSPGYPLYCLIGWIFSHLPIGDDIAYRMNLMSAFFGVLTVVTLYMIIYHFTRTPYLSFSISLAFAFSPVFWSQCLVAEVYTLNTFLTAIALYFMCRWLEKRTDGWMYAAFFTTGLAATNHQLAVLLVPTGIYLLFLFQKNEPRTIKFWVNITLLFLAGLLVYLYLPIRASADPPLNWGNPETFRGFMEAVFYPAKSQTLTASRWVHFIYAFKLWLRQFSNVIDINQTAIYIPALLLFGIWGIYKGISTKWRMARVFILFMLLNVAAILLLSRPNEDQLMIVGVYYLPVYMVFSVFVATGFREWVRQFDKTVHEKRKPFFVILIIIILIAIPEYRWWHNYPAINRSNDYYARDWGEAVLRECPKDTILMVNWDDIFTLWYLQKVENQRPDVIPVLVDLPMQATGSYWGGWYFYELKEKRPELFEDTGLGRDNFLYLEDAIAKFVKTNLNRKHDVYFSFYGLGYDFAKFSEHFNVFPSGPIYEATLNLYSPKDFVENRDKWERITKEFRNLYTYLEQRNIEEDFIIVRLSSNLLATSKVTMNFADTHPDAVNDSLWYLEQAIKIDESNFEAISEMASILNGIGRYEEAKQVLLHARNVDPYNMFIHLDLAQLFYTMGDYEASMDSVNRALAIDPDNPEAQLLKRILSSPEKN